VTCARSRPTSAARRRANGEARSFAGRGPGEGAGKSAGGGPGVGLGKFAFTMSARVILPLRPLPTTVSRSTCKRSASLRRSADTVAGALAGVPCAAVRGAVPAAGRDSRMAARRRWARTVPTGTSAPTGTTISSTTPFSNTSISMADFAVSTSAMTWPRWTSSPGFTYHWSKVPFSMSAPSAGMRKSLKFLRSLGSLMSCASCLESQQEPGRRTVSRPVRGGAGTEWTPQPSRPARRGRPARRRPDQ
jgi:hypothetical protein